jgi:hypothetical protein
LYENSERARRLGESAAADNRASADGGGCGCAGLWRPTALAPQARRFAEPTNSPLPTLPRADARGRGAPVDLGAEGPLSRASARGRGALLSSFARKALSPARQRGGEWERGSSGWSSPQTPGCAGQARAGRRNWRSVNRGRADRASRQACLLGRRLLLLLRLDQTEALALGRGRTVAAGPAALLDWRGPGRGPG